MFRNDPDKDWERFGVENPYYSVVNTEEYRSARLDDAVIEEVLQTGESKIAYFLHFLEQRFGEFPRGRALEFGCGVGRLLLPLARRYKEVIGIDVSPSMLREAKANRTRARLDNIDLLLSDDALSRVEGKFDFVLSYLVLQHIPVERGEQIIRGLLSRVAPGGVVALHVTVSRTTARWRHAIHVLRRNFLPLHALGNVVSGMRWNEPMMQSNLYDLERLREFVAEAGLVDVVELPVQHGDHVGLMIFAKRPLVAEVPVKVATP